MRLLYAHYCKNNEAMHKVNLAGKVVWGCSWRENSGDEVV